MNLLDIIDLNVNFPTKAGVVRASDRISLTIKKGESLCLVGESGCGKTIVALSIMRLLSETAQVRGKIFFNGTDLLSLSETEIRNIRGRDVAMIFEQPAACLNPVLRVGDQIAEAVRIHKRCSKNVARQKSIELMALVGIPSPHQRYRQYPHEFSGGMAQRAMIALAVALKPSLLIADEPTTAIDVTIQAHIMALLNDLTARFNTALFLITHDLGVAAQMCERVAVMYAGKIVETGVLQQVFKSPKHPYTKALVAVSSGEGGLPIDGTVPELSRLPDGCRFHPRCPSAQEICSRKMPEMRDGLRCHFHASLHPGVKQC